MPIVNFVGIGAAKSGTTTLYHHLAAHPGVYMSPIKEPNHFCEDIDPRDFSTHDKLLEKQRYLDLESYINGDMRKQHWGAFVKDRTNYEKLFRFRGDRIAGEISNSYLYSKVAAQSIREYNPNMKLLCVLRNPIDRAYSHYCANLRDGKVSAPVMDAIRADFTAHRKGWYISELYIELGLYFEQVRRFLHFFPAQQIHFTISESLAGDTDGEMQKVYEFLGLAPMAIDVGERFNTARSPKFPKLIEWATKSGLKKSIFRWIPDPMKKRVKSKFFTTDVPPLSEECRKELKTYFVEDVERLSLLLDRDLLAFWFGKDESA